jgi:hypothetical protein
MRHSNIQYCNKYTTQKNINNEAISICYVFMWLCLRQKNKQNFSFLGHMLIKFYNLLFLLAFIVGQGFLHGCPIKGTLCIPKRHQVKLSPTENNRAGPNHGGSFFNGNTVGVGHAH